MSASRDRKRNSFCLTGDDGDDEPANALQPETTACRCDRFTILGDRLFYITEYRERRFLPVTVDLDFMVDGASSNTLPVQTDHGATNRAGSVNDKVQATVSRQLGRKLDDGTSILFTPKKINAASVAARQILHALYLRLWRDLVGGQAEERPCTSRECGKEIEGMVRMQYCGDQCRTKFYQRSEATRR